MQVCTCKIGRQVCSDKINLQQENVIALCCEFLSFFHFSFVVVVVVVVVVCAFDFVVGRFYFAIGGVGDGVSLVPFVL